MAAGSGNIPANLAAPLIYEPGAQSYPIVNFEYIVVKSTQSSADVAMAIRTFLAFAISPTGGSRPALPGQGPVRGAADLGGPEGPGRPSPRSAG